MCFEFASAGVIFCKFHTQLVYSPFYWFYRRPSRMIFMNKFKVFKSLTSIDIDDRAI